MPLQDWPKRKGGPVLCSAIACDCRSAYPFFLLQVAGTCRNNQAGMGMIVTLAVVGVQGRMGYADPNGVLALAEQAMQSFALPFSSVDRRRFVDGSRTVAAALQVP